MADALTPEGARPDAGGTEAMGGPGAGSDCHGKRPLPAPNGVLAVTSPGQKDAARACPLCSGSGRLDASSAGELLARWLESGACRRVGLYPIPPGLRLSVVIPVYNEAATIAETIRAVRAVPIAKEIIVVDDGSTDGTREVLATLGGEDLRIIFHEKNQGKGAALTTGFRHVRGDIVIIQDADREYDPAEYPRLIQPIVEGKADVVYGSRFLGDGTHRVLYFWHYVGNRLLTTLSNMFTNLNLTDMETGYKVFRREVIEAIAPTLKQKRFGIEPELTAKVARRRYRIYETAISYAGRTYSEGKKIGWRDGLKALWCILRYWKWD
ncbi:MAG TPA: glycosyltransferase family 2 protein [Gemmataceae bacterium]|nr:glycosyltransferase family 2 protein [Gemmataceae bacterium]